MDSPTFLVFYFLCLFLPVSVLAYLVYVAYVGPRRGPRKPSISRALNLKRMFNMRNWPVAKARITAIDRELRRARSSLAGFGKYYLPDYVFLTFEYQVSKVPHTNQFVVLCNPQERFWGDVAVSDEELKGEAVMVHYDPENPGDSVPVDKTWHEMPIWKLG